jgi:phosphatidylglycerol:prolipoprotein diacylglycerol transferase
MHPILFNIPLTIPAFVALAVLLAAGSVIRTRFAIADRDANYLSTFLGINVKWGEVIAPWSKALMEGLKVGAITFVAVAGIKTFLPQLLLRVGQLPVHVYGVMMVSSFLTAIWLGTREATHEQLPPVPYLDPNGKQYVDKAGNKVFLQAADLVNDLSFYIIVSGLGGARILYIITRWEQEYSADPLRMFKVWEGGLVWYGGLLGATLTSFWFVRKNKVAFLPYADLLVPGVSLAHAIGRLGCFAAGCCFGNVAIKGFPLAAVFPADSPAAMEHLEHGLIQSATHGSLPVYPTQIMEALGEVIIFFILLRVRSSKRFHGQVLLTYFSMYAILRTIIEMFRGDSIRGFVFRWPNAEHPMLLSTSQTVSVLVAIVCISVTVAIGRSRSRTPTTAATA